MDDATAALRRTEKGDILGGGQVTTLPPVVPKVLAKKLPISCLAQCGDQEHPPPPPFKAIHSGFFLYREVIYCGFLKIVLGQLFLHEVLHSQNRS